MNREIGHGEGPNSRKPGRPRLGLESGGRIVTQHFLLEELHTALGLDKLPSQPEVAGELRGVVYAAFPSYQYLPGPDPLRDALRDKAHALYSHRVYRAVKALLSTLDADTPLHCNYDPHRWDEGFPPVERSIAMLRTAEQGGTPGEIWDARKHYFTMTLASYALRHLIVARDVPDAPLRSATEAEWYAINVTIQPALAAR